MAQRSSRGIQSGSLRNPQSPLRNRDVAKRTAGYGKWFAGWSFLHVLYAIFMSTIYYDKYFGGFGWLFTPVVTISSLVQVALGSAYFKLPTRVPWTVFGLFLYYAYALTCGILANSDFGRHLQNSLGWWVNCLVFYGALALSVIHATYVSEGYRELVKWAIVISLVASGLIALAQNLNIGGARTLFSSLELQPAGTYRPTGLTNYPSQLGFQGTLGMAIFGSALYHRNLRWWEWCAVAFFGLVVLNAQYRSMYYAGIALCGGVFAYLIWRRDRQGSAIFLIVATCVIAVPLIAFPNKFTYGLRSSKDDPALKVRELGWQQAQAALTYRPLTGIGPDPNLLVSSGMSERPDKFSTSVIDNLYRTVLACYGWIGVGLAAVFVLTTLCGVFLRIVLGARQAQQWAISSLILSFSILLFSLTGNSIVYTTVGCLTVIVFGLTGPTWREEMEQSTLTDDFVRFRRAFALMIRKIGINIG